jgi:hypothetical protein
MLKDEDLRTALKDEYLLLQNQYEDFDRRSLTIKGWFGGGAAAAVALGFGQKGIPAYFVLGSVALLAAVFWYLETHWKLFQLAHAHRIRFIEAYFRGEKTMIEGELAPFQIYNWWYRGFVEYEPLYHYEVANGPRSMWRRFCDVALQSFVCLPYVAVIGLCAAAAVVIWLGPKAPTEWI